MSPRVLGVCHWSPLVSHWPLAASYRVEAVTGSRSQPSVTHSQAARPATRQQHSYRKCHHFTITLGYQIITRFMFHSVGEGSNQPFHFCNILNSNVISHSCQRKVEHRSDWPVLPAKLLRSTIEYNQKL